MPKYHNWYQPVILGNASRRIKDRQRKYNSRGGTIQNHITLATYARIDKHVYIQRNIGGCIVNYYRLNDIAKIFNLSTNTVERWFNLYMLPPPAMWELFRTNPDRKRPLYTKAQVHVICTALNQLFEQDIKQFRQSHVHYVQMIHAGCEIAMQRMAVKLARS